jgi:hypothetical protein
MPTNTYKNKEEYHNDLIIAYQELVREYESLYVFNSVRTPVGLWVNKDGEGTNLGKVNDAFIIKIRTLKSAIKDMGKSYRKNFEEKENDNI